MQDNIPTLSLEHHIDVWRYEEGDVLLELPDKMPVVSKKSRVLEPFVKEFKKNLAYQSKVLEIRKFMMPMLRNINQVDSGFVCFSEEKNRIEIIILLNNKKYSREISKKLFKIRLSIEDRYDEQQIDFLYIPKLNRSSIDIIPGAFSGVYP